MKSFLFISALVAILSIVLIATPIEAQFEQAFPVVYTNEVKREFANNIKSNILNNVNFTTVSISKTKIIKRQILASVQLTDFVNKESIFTTFDDLRRTMLALARSLIIPVRDFTKGNKVTVEQLINIVGGCRKNIDDATRIFIGKLKSECKNNNNECKKALNDIKNELLKFV
ncbi:hypothetical protein C1645_829565 [Glomus cerebriforme]|uniref:Hydrophobic surface binding protein A-domain-containing protein n=1 Tax=Glomus cerebriforme TaxID=658196 RepID=A0A397SJA3_9GLOM|nr:hypothetical protein C1645_829565 [Glomus cerebriforme]